MAVADPNAPPAIAPEVQRELDMLRARVDFPLADQDLLRLMHGTGDEIRSAAQKLHEQAVKFQQTQLPPTQPAPTATQPPAPAPAQPQPTPSPAPGPAPVPAPTQAAPPEGVVDARYNELFYKVENRIAEPHERQEFFMSALRNGWNQQVEQMNARRR